MGSSSSSGPVMLGSDGPAVDQLSRETRARVRCPEGSTSSLGRFGPVPKGLQCRQTILGNSGPGPITHGVDQLSWATLHWV